MSRITDIATDPYPGPRRERLGGQDIGPEAGIAMHRRSRSAPLRAGLIILLAGATAATAAATGAGPFSSLRPASVAAPVTKPGTGVPLNASQLYPPKPAPTPIVRTVVVTDPVAPPPPRPQQFGSEAPGEAAAPPVAPQSAPPAPTSAPAPPQCHDDDCQPATGTPTPGDS